MRLQSLLAAFAVCSCHSAGAKIDICGGRMSVTSSFEQKYAKIIFLKGNVYIGQSWKPFLKVDSFSAIADKRVREAVEVAQSHSWEKFKARGDVAGDIVDCGDARRRVHVMKILFNDVSDFTQEDFEEVLKARR